MARITKAMRDAIGARIRKTAFAAEFEELQERSYRLAEDIRVARNGGPDLTNIIDAAPDHFFRMEWTAAYSSKIHHRSSARVAANDAPDYSYGRFRNRVEALVDEREKLERELAQMVKDVDQALIGLGNTKAAIEAFPEFADLLVPEPPNTNLPAVLVADLRDKLRMAGTLPSMEAG